MPFTKITGGKDKGKHRSESGRVYTDAQMRLYYGTGGFQQKKGGGLLWGAKAPKGKK